MLYLTRKPGETIVIEENIEITVISVSGKSVKLGFSFPEDISILRKEVFDRIQSENRAAAETAFDPAKFNLTLTAKSPLLARDDDTRPNKTEEAHTENAPDKDQE